MVEVGVVGASGYGGGELLRLLLRHPEVTLRQAVSETYAGKPLAAAFPGLAGQSDLRFAGYEDGTEIAQCDVVFLAQENGKAMGTAPHLLEAGCKLIDLSADFRFRDTATYEAWYKPPHAAPQWNARAVYGLPELYAEQIRGAQLVGNPGCYPTAAILALAPLLSRRCIDPSTLIVDAKSGVSGAGGRVGMKEEFSFPAVNENFRAYSVTGHRHVAETEQELALLAGRPAAETRLSFTPHLLPITRGIYATVYASLRAAVDLDTLIREHQEFYRQAPFVHVAGAAIPEIRHVIGSNLCRIGMALDERVGRVVVMAVIDNLVKGAAGQAVQNMNLMLGLPETTGLEAPAIYP
jgi:N-acetyl-gamma-glutamyl-phosphate reductase